jgi:hypothetical protein
MKRTHHVCVLETLTPRMMTSVEQKINKINQEEEEVFLAKIMVEKLSQYTKDHCQSCVCPRYFL